MFSSPERTRTKLIPTAPMDFFELQSTFSSKAFEKVGEICDELMLQAASMGVAFEEEWPYAIHLLGHIYVNDLNSARFMWKSIPSGVKETRPEILAAWSIAKCLWTRDHAGVYGAISGFEWGPEVAPLVSAFAESYTKKMFQMLLSAYSTITVADTAHFLGMSEEDAINYALQHGWTLDPSSNMLTVKKPKIVTEQKVDSSKLQRLTEYVFHLEH